MTANLTRFVRSQVLAFSGASIHDNILASGSSVSFRKTDELFGREGNPLVKPTHTISDPKEIFISYSHKDLKTAERLARALEGQGWSVWWDRTMFAGESFDESIQKALDGAECVIVIWSSHSVNSRWVRAEAYEGFDRKILVPVLGKKVRIPVPFNVIHTEDLTAWDGTTTSRSFLGLTDAIEIILGPPHRPLIPQFEVTYGGKQKKSSYKLAISPNHIVTRINRQKPFGGADRLNQKPAGWAAMERVFCYEHAGVEVYRITGPTKEVSQMRDRWISRLKRNWDIRFAGRVLCDPETRSPVLYTENLFVKFRDGIRPSTCRRILRSYGSIVKRDLSYAENAYFVQFPEGVGLEIFELAAKILSMTNVEFCHPELIWPAPRRAAFPEQWHLKPTVIRGNLVNQHAHVEAAWELSEGNGVTIAVIDDGFDLHHEEFATPWKIVAPRDIASCTENPSPGNADHAGTACAGVACANGFHHASGVAPKARLMPIRLPAALGSRYEADAFVWAADNGADVISCSWGPADAKWFEKEDPIRDQIVPLPDSTRLAIDYAIAHGRGGKGCVIIWAAGNGNECVDNDGYASNPRVIAVGACNDRGKRSPYSDFGKALWCCFPSSHGLLPSLTNGIWTTDRSGKAGFSWDDYTDDFGGTSSACQGGAGVAALILACNPVLRWDEVKDIIRRSCDQIDLLNGCYDTNAHSSQYGYGRINARRAVELAQAEAVPG